MRALISMIVWVLAVLLASAAAPRARRLPAAEEAADLILHGAKVVTADAAFSIREAIAVRGDRIARVGSSEEILELRGPGTTVLDLGGRTVLPGLIDSHVHACDASMTEHDHPVPVMSSIEDVLAYVSDRALALPEGAWIEVRQVFITRLREQRYPSRAELDRAAPRHPVVFATGPDASLNGLALERSGIRKGFAVSDGGPGRVELDPATGEPTGILRGCTRLVKAERSGREPAEEDRGRRLANLLRDYNSNGITAVLDRDASPEELERYRRLRDEGRLTVRVMASHHVEGHGSLEKALEDVRKAAAHPLRRADPWLRVIGVKAFLDGGMLTGSAYLREPWGVSRIYGITDPEYRGLLFIPREKLLPIVRAAVEAGLQFTAHSVGDGAVHALLDAYEEVGRSLPLRATRPCLTHSNFMSREAIEAAARMGVLVDAQPAWLYLDARTLVQQFGYDRLRWFQPWKSIFRAGGVAGGGSDHMQKVGAFRSVNPYSPFLGMWVAVSRRARGYEGRLHPEEALTREEALRLYTSSNARLLFLEDQAGSLEEGKLADLIVLDRDVLSCPEEAIPGTRVLRTYAGGRLVHEEDGSGIARRLAALPPDSWMHLGLSWRGGHEVPACFDPANRLLFKYGGCGDESPRANVEGSPRPDETYGNSCWVANLSTGEWEMRRPRDVSFPADRPANGCSRGYCYDSKRKVIWMYGGISNGGGGGDPWDLWTYDAKADRFTRAHSTGRPPGGDEAGGDVLVYDPLHDLVIVPRGDTTWVYGPGENAWEERKTPGGPPRPGHYASMVFDAAARRLVYPVSDRVAGTFTTWTYDPESNRWERLAERHGEPRPSPRWRFGLAYDSRNAVVVLIGGSTDTWDEKEEYFNDVWVLETSRGTWRKMDPGPPLPEGRNAWRDCRHCAYDEADNAVLWMPPYGDLWAYRYR
ncbi:MAG: amidohydrolase family protein [Planctomycetes bacterium]|nr:amidohydrolase family protein [Planctomycetota bacterium]